MTADPGGRWLMAAVGGVCLLTGVAVSYVFMSRDSSPAESAPLSEALSSRSTGTAAVAVEPGQPLPDVSLSLPADLLTLSGIVVQPAGSGSVNAQILVSGVVEPNTTRHVLVTAPAASRVLSVTAEIGTKVERGHVLAQLESPDLSFAQSQMLSARTAAATALQELQKIEKLAAVGAVSRQELERVKAEQMARQREADDARARLADMGMSAEQMAALLAGEKPSSTTTVLSPSNGTIVELEVERGRSIDAGARLFVVADLSTIWVAGDLHEREIARVRVGSAATVTMPEKPEVNLKGNVIFIDPLINPTTHSARIRVEVPNTQPELPNGSKMTVEITDALPLEATLVPQEAVQNVGDRRVLYLQAGQPGSYIEREVVLGPPAPGEQVAILSGIKTGDPIVARGSGFLLSERERLGLRR